MDESTPQGDSQESSIVDSLASFISDDGSVLDEPRRQEPADDQGDNPDVVAQAEPTEPQPERIKVKVNGEEIEVPKDELIKAYQKDKAADQRFQEAAELRKTADTETEKARSERTQLQQALTQYTQQLQALQQVNDLTPQQWEHLLQNDPQEFQRQRFYLEQRNAQLQQAQAQLATLQQMERSEAQKATETRLATEATKLLEVLPTWKDATVAQKEKTQIAEYLKGLGFGDEVLGNIQDHREVLLARKAMLYDQLQTQAAQASKRVEKLPPKAEKPGVADPTAQDDGLKSAKNRLARSGKVEDAAAVFARMFS